MNRAFRKLVIGCLMVPAGVGGMVASHGDAIMWYLGGLQIAVGLFILNFPDKSIEYVEAKEEK